MKLLYKNEGWAEHEKRKHGDKAKSESKGAKRKTDTSGKVRALCLQQHHVSHQTES